MKKWFALIFIVASLLIFSVLVYKVIVSETYQILGEIIHRVNTDKKIVALTFDDGPNQRADEILQVLADKQVTATFFLIGSAMEEYSSETQKIVEAGHEVGNHSYTHKRMVFKPYSFITKEIDTTNQLIRDNGFSGEMTFRPPYGKKFLLLPYYLQSQNIKTIMWDVEPVKALGPQASTEQITEYVVNQTQPGSIILIHPWYGETNPSREAIGPIIDHLQNQGYEFVSISELTR